MTFNKLHQSLHGPLPGQTEVIRLRVRVKGIAYLSPILPPCNLSTRENDRGREREKERQRNKEREKRE